MRGKMKVHYSNYKRQCTEKDNLKLSPEVKIIKQPMNSQTNSLTKDPKTKTQTQPKVLEQTDAASLAQWEKQYKLWKEYYQCCGGY
jgi:hypothetical protein